MWLLSVYTLTRTSGNHCFHLISIWFSRPPATTILAIKYKISMVKSLNILPASNYNSLSLTSTKLIIPKPKQIFFVRGEGFGGGKCF